MTMIVLCHFDKKLGVYSAPFTVADSSDEDIIENTRRMCANPQLPKAYFDYDLYRLGSFDDKRGACDIEEKPVFLVSLSDFKHLAEEEVKEHEIK